MNDFEDSDTKVKRNGETVIDSGHKGTEFLPLNPLGN